MKTIRLIILLFIISSNALAQSFTITVKGKAVTNDQLVKINYKEVPVNWIVPNVIGTYSLDPEIQIHATQEQEITITAWDDIQDGILQLSSFSQCIPITSSNCPVSASGTIRTNTDAAIRLTYGSKNPGTDFQRTLHVRISNNVSSIQFAVQFNIDSNADVDEIEVEESDNFVYFYNQKYVNGDINQDGVVSIEDVTTLVNMLTGKLPISTPESLLEGKWKAKDGETISFNSDGTTNYHDAATFKYSAVDKLILIYDSSKMLKEAFNVLDANDAYLLLKAVGKSDSAKAYYNTKLQLP